MIIAAAFAIGQQKMHAPPRPKMRRPVAALPEPAKCCRCYAVFGSSWLNTVAK